MAQRIEFDGEVHEFPDDFTDADIAKALGSHAPATGDKKQALSAQKPVERNPAMQFGAGAVEASLGLPGDLMAATGFKPPANDKLQAMLDSGVPADALPVGLTPSRTINRSFGLPEEAPPEGSFARTAGNFAGNALLPGSGAARLSRVAVPTIASEGLSRTPGVKGTVLEPWARLVGGLAGVIPGEAIGATATNVLSRVPRIEPTPNQVNSFPAGFRVRQPPAKTTKQAVDRGVISLFERAGGAKAAQERAAPYRAEGRDPYVFQMADQPGAQRAQTLASAPGKTPTLARQAVRQTREELPGRAQGAFDDAFAAPTRAAAKTGIDNAFDELSPQYDALLRGAEIPETLGPKVAEIEGLIPIKIHDEVMNTVADIAQLEGKSIEQMSGAEKLHMLKRGLSQVIGSMQGKPGLKPDVVRGLTLAGQRLNAIIEEAVPGYKALNAKWGAQEQSLTALGEAGESGGFASDFFNKGTTAFTEAEMRTKYLALPPEARNAADASIVNQAKLMIENASRDGAASSDVAKPFLIDTITNRLRAILGDKADPLISRLRTASTDFEDTGYINPRKYAAAQQGLDLADQTAGLANVLGKANPLEAAAGAAWRTTIGRVVDPVAEHFRDLQGQQLLGKWTPEYESSTIAELVKRAGRRRSAGTNALMTAPQAVAGARR